MSGASGVAHVGRISTFRRVFLACERAKQVLLSTPPPMAYLWIESQYFGALKGLGWLILDFRL